MSDDRPTDAEPSAEPAAEPGAHVAPTEEPAIWQSEAPTGGRRVKRRRRGGGCLSMLALLVVLAVLGYIYVPRAIDAVQDRFAEPEDFAGPGSGRVTVQVVDGATAGEVGRTLVDDGVVASVEAFTDAVAASTSSIQSGVFVLKREMSAAEALAVISDRGNDQSINLTLLPGKTVDEIVGLLSEDTDFSRRQYERALARPSGIGLPDYADGDAEGYLFPGEYVFGPDDTPQTILRAMTTRFTEYAERVDLVGRADELGYTPHQLVTVASLIQAEGATVDERDRARIARVVYNRLEVEPNPSAGFLQLDATVNFALGEDPDDLTVRLTLDQIYEGPAASSPYNTYTQKGLPPGAIESAGESAFTAALNPADGPWFYYVTVNLRTGLTKFATTDEEFQQLRAELDEYCVTQSDRC